MATADLAHAAPRFRLGWIAGPATDLPWFIGGAVAGYALFAMHAALAWDMATVGLLWYVLLDIPHFFGTYVRTYLDPVERRRRPLLLWGSLALPLVGPALVLACLGLHRAGVENHRLPLDILFVFVGLWAYWHIVRQHYGIMALYKRKNADTSPTDAWIDKPLLYAGLYVPFVAVLLRHPQARELLRLPPELGLWEQAVLVAGAALVAVLAAALLARQIDLLRRGEAVDLPKILFLLAVVPLHLVIGFHPATLTADLFSFGAFVTIFHDIQYHAIVWHAQQAKLSRPGAEPGKHGLAAVVSRHFLLYAGAALAMGIAAWFIGCSLDIRPGCVPMLKATEIPLFGDITLAQLLFVIVSGFIMHHYFVDGYIWRPSKDAEVRKDLGTA